MRFPLAFFAGLVLCTAVSVRADELKLKDGTKISGTIVGFEENSFRVKTSYGFAVVQKDQVLSISISDSSKKADEGKKADAEKKSDPSAEKTTAPAKAAAKDEGSAAATAPRVAKTEDSSAPGPNGVTDAKSSVAPANGVASTPGKVVAKGTPATSTAVAANIAPAPPPPAPKPDVPEVIHEEVSGNTYINDTYGFHMYKPPDWQVIDGARTLLPGAITAMGTNDETTYLLIGQEPAGKPLAASMDATDKRLREVMDNFRPLGDKHVTVAGSDAVERRFRGSVDQHDWSGVVAIVPHGARVFTIFGMTYADTDLVQIQENVISRAISSLQFTKP
jgi:hypothetical protein